MTTLLATLAIGMASATIDTPRVEMTIENRGQVVMELYPDKAPKTVEHFQRLVRSGFYNGILFHRVENKPRPFVVTTGDPLTKTLPLTDARIGTGGSGTKVPFEKNDLAFANGTVGLSRDKENPNSGDSQFFITLGPQPFLEGTYVAFGRVIQGLDILKTIRLGDKIVSMRITG
ncbi:MAG: peptidylprolyl isomerase [Fimbriimonadales bacterium]